MRTILLLLLSVVGMSKTIAQTYRIGAKHFNEGYILGELIAQIIESEGYKVERKFNLGGTAVCFEALRNQAIDVYPEYTGSLAEEILKSKESLDHQQLNNKLRIEMGLEISPSFGFNNTYAIATKKDFAVKYDLQTISDLRQLPSLSLAFSYEFLERQDGWANLKSSYQLGFTPVGIEHGLAYQALMNGSIDMTDVYSTDGEITKYDLKVLKDDLNFFPDYQAVAVYNASLDTRIKKIISRLESTITEEEMQSMNAQVVFENESFYVVARNFLIDKGLVEDSMVTEERSVLSEVVSKSITHLWLCGIALMTAILVAVPLGVLLYFFSGISRPVLYFVGLLQTIPSIALLALMIPLFGIGIFPAIVALFLYALLPILRNTTTGLYSVDPVLKKVATGMGMNAWQQLRWVELPLAMPSLLAGIRTAAVITIGTATLAAFIGAGGLGEFIVTGLALNNIQLILQGAIPAAILAILIEMLFEGFEHLLLPKHLRKN